MKLNEYQEIIEKYEKKYMPKLEKNKIKFIDCMKNYTKEEFTLIMSNHRRLIIQLILDVINEFEEFRHIPCCIMLSGSMARGTNTLYSDIDLNYFYYNKNFYRMINIEERVNYILQRILRYKGKDRIHSMVVYLPLIKNDDYEAIKNNEYPIYFDDGIIYNRCRGNAEELMYQTFNSTRDIHDLTNYLNYYDNSTNMNEWANCFKLIFDNGLYKEFVNNRECYKGTNDIKQCIINILDSIEKDSNYIDENVKFAKIKYLKYFYKMMVLHNAYQILAIYFRMDNRFEIINIIDFEEKNIGISQKFYDIFYKYLNLVQKLQYLLDSNNMDLSFHSTKSISTNKLNEKYKSLFKSNNIIFDLNKLKYEFYEICKSILKDEVKKYEK